SAFFVVTSKWGNVKTGWLGRSPVAARETQTQVIPRTAVWAATWRQGFQSLDRGKRGCHTSNKVPSRLRTPPSSYRNSRKQACKQACTSFHHPNTPLGKFTTMSIDRSRVSVFFWQQNAGGTAVALRYQPNLRAIGEPIRGQNSP